MNGSQGFFIAIGAAFLLSACTLSQHQASLQETQKTIDSIESLPADKQVQTDFENAKSNLQAARDNLDKRNWLKHEVSSEKAQLDADLATVQQSLAQNRSKIADLQAKIDEMEGN